MINEFLLVGDTCMAEMHLIISSQNAFQPGFTYSAWGPFTKNKKRIQKFKETGDLKPDIAYKDFIDLPRRADSHKVLSDKVYLILLKILTMTDVKEVQLQQFILFYFILLFFDKMSADAITLVLLKAKLYRISIRRTQLKYYQN